MIDYTQLTALAQSIKQLDVRLRELANREPIQPGWTAPTLINSWANSGGAYAPAGYYKDTFNVVHLRGRVTTGTAPSDAFVLPAKHRPEYTLTFSVPTSGVVDVEADGSVRVVSGSTVSLDSISFRAFA